MSDDLGALLEEARALRGSLTSGNSAATVNVNAGGIGVIIAVGACMLMLAVNVMQLADRTRMDNEIRELRAADKRHDDYLNAIYRRQPTSKPEESQ